MLCCAATVTAAVVDPCLGGNISESTWRGKEEHGQAH